MMFLLRLTFWFLVICLLLPSSRDDNNRIIASAGKTVDDVRGFCDRNPDVCGDVRSFFTGLFGKIRTSTEVLETWIAPEEKMQDRPSVDPVLGGEDERRNSAIPQSPAFEAPPSVSPQWHNNLSPTDKRVTWRGPSGS